MPTQTCAEIVSHLSDYIDGVAAEATCVEIERHLATCEHCRIVVDTMRKTVELYHQLPQNDLPAETRTQLYIALDLADYLPDRPTPH